MASVFGVNPPIDSEKKTLPEYSDQCFLLDFISEISGWKGSRLDATFKNFGLLHPKGPSAPIFYNKLLSQPGIQEFLDDLPRTVASDLKPNVRLFKVIQGTKQQIALELPVAGGRINMMESQRETNIEAVSLKAFNFDYLGTQPAEVDYYINCNMVLHFASGDAFFREHKATTADGKEVVYSFSDLIVRYSPRRNKQNKVGDIADTHREFDSRKFRIRVDIEYNPDESSLAAKFGGGPHGRERAARFSAFLRSSKLSLYLSLLKHTFTPLVKHATETAFELSIDYNGAVEAAFLSPKANILIAPEGEALKAKDTEFEKLKTELANRELAGAQLSPKQEELISNLTLDQIKANLDWKDHLAANPHVVTGIGALWELGGAAFGSTSGIERIIDSEIGDQLKSVASKKNKTIDSDEQIKKVKKYLKGRNSLEKQIYSGNTRDVLTENKLIQAYNRPLTKLYEQNKIYVITKQNDQLLKWFKARAGIISVDTKEIERLQKKIDDPNTKTEDKEKAIKRQATIRQEKAAFDSVTGEIQKEFEKKPLKQSTQDHKLKADMEKKNKAMKEIVKSDEKKKDEKIEDYEELITVKDPLQDSNERPIYFFYYGDLVDVIMDFLQTPEYRSELDLDIWSTSNNKGNVRFLLGNITYADKNGKLKEMSLAKVPISLELWEQWWLQNVIRKGKEIYLFKAFLRDSITTLVKTAFTNRCKLPGQPVNRIKLSIDHIAIKPNNKLRIGKVDTTVHGGRLDAWHYSLPSSTPPNQLYNKAAKVKDLPAGEMVFINATSDRVGFLNGKKKEDMTYGISHISAVGGENKPIKSIEFTKTDQPMFLEAKAERGGILKNDVQMSEPYHANMTIFGHTVWKPGQKIYMFFPGTWFSTKQAQRMGLGGYYVLTKVSNTIQRTGKRYDWVSKLECKWEAMAGESKKPTYNERMEKFRLTAKGGGSGETEEGDEGEGEGEETKTVTAG